MTDYIGVKGRYRPYDQDTEYLYIGRYTTDFPSHWETKVHRSDDRFSDVLKEFRVELSGPLVDIAFCQERGQRRRVADLFQLLTDAGVPEIAI
jgi:hypothetical protein